MRRRWLIAVVAALALAGCTGPDAATGTDRTPAGPVDQSTPESTVAALVAAANAADDAAVDRLLCPAARARGRGIAEARAALLEVEPSLTGFGYKVTAGEVVQESAEAATTTLMVSVLGLSGNVPPAAQQFLDSSEIPRPFNLTNQDGRLHLVRDGARWFGCTPPTA
jgi:hypothetical protein